jgi:hypothetical protein
MVDVVTHFRTRTLRLKVILRRWIRLKTKNKAVKKPYLVVLDSSSREKGYCKFIYQLSVWVGKIADLIPMMSTLNDNGAGYGEYWVIKKLYVKGKNSYAIFLNDESEERIESKIALCRKPRIKRAN